MVHKTKSLAAVPLNGQTIISFHSVLKAQAEDAKKAKANFLFVSKSSGTPGTKFIPVNSILGVNKEVRKLNQHERANSFFVDLNENIELQISRFFTKADDVCYLD